MNIPPYPQEGQPVSYLWGRAIVDCLRALRVRAGAGLRAQESSSGTILSAAPQAPSVGAAGMDFSVFCFGHSISGSVVTIKSGDIIWAEHEPVVVPDTSKAITVDYQYVGIDIVVESGVLTYTLPDPTTDKSVFRSGDGHWRRWFAQFRLVAGKAVLYRIGKIGNVDTTSWGGD